MRREKKRVLQTALAAALLALMAVAGGAGQNNDAFGFELREIDGVPVLYENGMPYFTRFTRTDHQLLDLSGTWKFKPDPEDLGKKQAWFSPELDDSSWFNHPVPGTWCMQKPEWLNYRGSGWFRLRFKVPASFQGRFNRLVMDGVVFYGDVYLNGNFLGAHQGGYSRFSLDVSDLLNYGGENLLAVRVDNRLYWRSVPPRPRNNPDYMGWWPYGGINRKPFIESGPHLTLAKLAVDTDHTGRLKVTAVVFNHSPETAEGLLRVWIDTDVPEERPGYSAPSNPPSSDDPPAIASRSASLKLGQASLKVPGKGLSVFRLDKTIEGVIPWSPERPRLYRLHINLSGGGGSETQSVDIGFRTFEFRGHQAYLNGKPVFLRGMNRHEDFPDTGAVQTDHWIRTDMKLLHELNVNFMRMAHYPHDPRWLDACDREGIMVVHEIPNYWAGSSPLSLWALTTKRYFNNCARQLVETIERDRNHPSVVMWSVGNENQTYLPPVKRYHKRLYDTAKRVDPARPVTFALLSAPLLPYLELTAPIADVLFINEYFGWYVGDCEDVDDYLELVHRRWPDKPVVISEFGAGSVSPAPGRTFRPGVVPRDFSEDYQAEFYRRQFKILLAKPYLTGTMPWIFADFRDKSRPENHPVPGFNLKGLVTQTRKKKKAFFVVAETYGKIEKGEITPAAFRK